MKNLVKWVALGGAATTAGVGASQRRDHLQLQGPVTNCYLGPDIQCTKNATHILFLSPDKQTMMVKGPNGIYTVEAEHGHPLGNQPSPPPVVPKPTKNPSSTPPPALAQYLDPARPGTPAPAQPRTPAPPQASSSNFPLDSVVGPVVALFILAIIGYPVFRHIRHERNRIPIPEIPMATITNERNVVAPQPNSLLGIAQEDLRVAINNALPHRQPVYNAIPAPPSPPSYNGIMGVPLNPQNQQPQVSANLNSEGLASAPESSALDFGIAVVPDSTPPGLPPSPPPLTISLVLPSQGVDVSPATSAPASATEQQSSQQVQQTQQQTLSAQLVYYARNEPLAISSSPTSIVNFREPGHIASQQPPQRTQQRAAAFASADLVFRQP